MQAVASSARSACSPAAAIRRCARVGAPACRCSCRRDARGAYAFDESGRRYIDYIMAYGPLLFGHTHPQLVEGLDETRARAVSSGAIRIRKRCALPERVRAHLPSMERLRFVSTGTEAVMSAIRVARAFTGRDRVSKFAGDYHGHSDFALIDAGASAQMRQAAIPREHRAMRCSSRGTTISTRSIERSNEVRRRTRRNHRRANRRQHGAGAAGDRISRRVTPARRRVRGDARLR